MTEPSDNHLQDPPTDAERADELASAFVDGEVTADEIVLIEADPSAPARIAEFESVAAASAAPVTPPPASVRAGHLAAAMSAFENAKSIDLTASPTAQAAASTPVHDTSPSEPVVDLTAAREARASRNNRWLATAAAGFLVVGGIGLASLQFGSNDESTDTASADFAGGDDESDAAESDDAAEAPASTVAASNAAGASEALQDEAMEEEFSGDATESEPATDESADVEEAMEDHEAASDADSADTDVDTETGELQRSPIVARGGSVFPVPAEVFDQLVDEAQFFEPLPLDESLCAATLGITDGWWYQVELDDGELLELIIEFTATGEEVPVLADATCQFGQVAE